MALRFFWRGESATLDGTNDYSAGDTTGSSNSGIVCDSTVAVVSGNTNSVYVAGGGDHFRFDNAGIHDDLDSVGSAAFAFRVTTNPGGDSECGLKIRGGSTVTLDQTTTIIRGSFSSNTGAVRFRHAGTTLAPSGSGAALSANTTYGVVIRWDQPNSLRRLEIYSAAGTLIEAVQDTNAFTAPTWSQHTDGGLRVGEDSGYSIVCGIANAMISDAYADPLEDYLFLNSYSAIGGGATPTITDAGDGTYTNGETGIVITGTNFGASQGTGSVKISPTDNVADAGAITQTVTAWGATSVTITAVRSTLALNTTCYLFVTADGNYTNASGLPVSFYTVGDTYRRFGPQDAQRVMLTL